MLHNAKRGAGVKSMSLSLRNQRVQNHEMYLVDDIDTKLLRLRNPRKCPPQLLQGRLRIKSLDGLRLRLIQLLDQRHRLLEGLPGQHLTHPTRSTHQDIIIAWLLISLVRTKIPIHSTSEPSIAPKSERYTAQPSRRPT
jgi:hypothetical protein